MVALLPPLSPVAHSLAVSAQPSKGLAAVPFAPLGVVLRPAPRLADARPDREEQARPYVAALFAGEHWALSGDVFALSL